MTARQDPIDFAYPTPDGEDVRFRLYVDQEDTHVHVRMFVGRARPGATLALAGRLVLSPDEFRTLLTVFAIQEHVGRADG